MRRSSSQIALQALSVPCCQPTASRKGVLHSRRAKGRRSLRDLEEDERPGRSLVWPAHRSPSCNLLSHPFRNRINQGTTFCTAASPPQLALPSLRRRNHPGPSRGGPSPIDEVRLFVSSCTWGRALLSWSTPARSQSYRASRKNGRRSSRNRISLNPSERLTFASTADSASSPRPLQTQLTGRV